MTSRIHCLLGLCALGLAAQACAHRGEPVQRRTVSTVSNEDVTGNPAEPDKKRMSYTQVSNEDALNQDRTHVEHEALNGHLNRGDAPVPALRTNTPDRQAQAQTP
jgi:hypothetical protein